MSRVLMSTSTAEIEHRALCPLLATKFTVAWFTAQSKGEDTYSLSVPRSAPANRHENRRNPDASGNEEIIIHRKDSRWFTEADEHDGVTDVEVCENPDEFYRREHQQTLHQAHINKTENSMPTLNNAMLEDRNDDRSVTNLYAHDKSGYTHQQTCETNQASGVVADQLPESLNELGDSEEKETPTRQCRHKKKGHTMIAISRF